MESKKLIGLIGYPLSHSFSQSYFREKFKKNKQLANFDYLNFPIKKIEDIHKVIKENQELIGFNVTIPYKEQILKYLDKIDDTAKKIAAVNTVKIHRINNQIILEGYNTDVYGFEKSLLPFLKPHHKKALILGTGGASKAVAYVLKKLGIDFLFVSRNSADKHQVVNYSELNRQLLQEYLLIVNTTPLGMYPNIDSAPEIPYDLINKDFLLFDLIYNPEKTKFLKLGEQKGAKIVNGYKMLVYQAEKAWEIFNLNL